MANTDVSPAAAPTNVRWSVFSLAFSISALLYLHRYVFAFIKPTLAEEYKLSNTQLGQLDSAFSVCYAGFQFPLGIAADVLGVHLVLTGLIVLWCAAMGLMAWAPSVSWLWFSRAALGTGQSAVYACLSRVARTWYPPAVRTTLQGSVGVLAGRLGALSSSVVFTTLLLGVWGLDWRSAVWILVAVGVVNVLLFVFVFRNSPREHPSVNEAEARLIDGESGSRPDLIREGEAPDTLTFRATLRLMTPRSLMNLIWLSLQNVLSTFADNIYSNWIPLFLSQVHGLKFKEMGIYSALPLLGGAIAGVTGGMLNDFLIARTGNRRWSRVSVAFVGKGLAAVLMFVALIFFDRPYVFCSILFFVKLFGDWSLTTNLGVITDIGGKATASVYAFSNSIAGIALIAAPMVFGPVSEHYGWRPVFVIVGVTYALCALSWLVIDCTILVVRETPPEK
ncbi:MAG: MFS transporter [Planctomycetota bacterium]|nr:MAG: MFS transporter [Planctomycetota bacterium]GDY08105.1 MFS transporter [Planctomycetia bacterium]